MDGSIIPALMPRWATIRATSLRATMPMPTKARKFVAKKFTITSYMVFTPVFFAGVGMKTNLRDMNSSILAFALLLVAAAVLSKVVGCGLVSRQKARDHTATRRLCQCSSAT